MTKKTTKKSIQAFKDFKKKRKILEQTVKSGGIPTITRFLARKDARAVKMYVEAVVAKFGKYIKAIAVGGSTKTGVGRKKTSDIDVPIIVDDTDVKRMTRPELKEKLFQKLCEMAYPISKKLHPQPYLLTEAWEYIREGNPVFYNLVLTNSTILYDTGFLLPIQMLVKMGNFKPSKEAIDKHIYAAKKLVELTKSTLLHKLTMNLEQAVVSSSQAVLMQLGYRPPAPKETPDFVKKFLVDKKGIVSDEYAQIAKKVIQTYKDIEHKDKKKISGAEFDELYELTNKFVDKMVKVLEKLRKEAGETWKYEIHEKKEKPKIKRDGLVSLKKDEDNTKNAEKVIKEELGQR